MAFKPRIVITIVTEDSKSEVEIIKGMELRDGSRSPGPTKKQIEIAYRAVRDLMADSIPGEERTS